MEHHIMDTDGINCLASQLGWVIEDEFQISDECQDTLEQLVELVEREGPNQCNIRHRLGMLEVLPKKLLPLVVSLNSDFNKDMDINAIFSLTTRLIMYLTHPTESVGLPTSHMPQWGVGVTTGWSGVGSSNSITGRRAKEMQDYLWQYKNAFLEKHTLNVFFSQIQSLLDEAKDGELTSKDCETVNMFLLIIRNILFTCQQELIDSKYADIILLRLLFQAGFAKLIIELMLMKQHVLWCAAIVQILSLIYKKREAPEVKEFISTSSGVTAKHSHPGTNPGSDLIAKQPTPANGMMKGENPESPITADTEKEIVTTTPSRPASPPATIPTSSTLEAPPNGSRTELQRQSPVESEVGSGSGSLTISSGSQGSGSQNGGSSGGHEADGSYTSEEKLDEHVEASLLQIETKLCLTLNEFRVRQELLMFTYTMLQQNVFNRIIEALNGILIFKKNVLPDVYFMWLIVHFLRVAQQGEVKFNKIKSCLTVDMVSYLTYVGVASVEDMLATTTSGRLAIVDPMFPRRRYHLALLAIQEIINSIHHLLIHDKSPEVATYLRELTEFLLNMRDLRSLLLLTIRRQSITAGNTHFLCDAVVLNHSFLLLAEVACLESNNSKRINNFNMLQHVQGFATMEVMAQYGSLLENYYSNSPLLNDCIFTMMHHVAGDCGAPQTLMQLPILRSFSDIWDDNHDLPQECQDLIHFTLDTFLMQAEGSPYECAKYLFGMTTQDEIEMMDMSSVSSKKADSVRTMEQVSDSIMARTDDPAPVSEVEEQADNDLDDLLMIYQDYADHSFKDIVQLIQRDLEAKGICKTKRDVMLQLYGQDLCTEEDLLTLTREDEDKADEPMDTNEPDVSTVQPESPTISERNDETMQTPTRDVDTLVRILRDQGHAKMLEWVQTVLLETCYVKIGGRRVTAGKYPEEPVPLHYTLQNKSVPLVTYVETQERMLDDVAFMLLMEGLGLHLPSDTSKAYPAIPNFWTPVDLLSAAKKLGPINFEECKFCEEVVTDSIDENLMCIHKTLMNYTLDAPRQAENTQSMSNLWNTFIQQCNINKQQVLADSGPATYTRSIHSACRFV